jgi:2-dehydro-3-deoxygalactonokinase
MMTDSDKPGNQEGQAFCVAVDWGTSSFRLWVLAANGAVIGESRGLEGMAIAAASPGGFPDVLARHLAAAKAPADAHILIAGMAGARQGWREAPYITTPALLADVAAGAIAVDYEGRDVRILPGVAQTSNGAEDVMRGEETQLLGAGMQDGMVCIPGTHSKWVSLQDSTVTHFNTFMTGELFAVLGTHSILQHGVTPGAQIAPDGPAFLEAVREMQADGAALTAKLFSVRARGLVGDADGASGAARLSGLLIGAEIAAARPDGPVTLLASDGASELYAAALAAAGIQTKTLDAEMASQAGLLRAAHMIWS